MKIFHSRLIPAFEIDGGLTYHKLPIDLGDEFMKEIDDEFTLKMCMTCNEFTLYLVDDEFILWPKTLP